MALSGAVRLAITAWLFAVLVVLTVMVRPG
jgi:hypothetical protein